MKAQLAALVFLMACGDDGAAQPDALVQIDASLDAPPDGTPSFREGMVVISELRGTLPGSTAAANLSDGRLYGGPTSTAGGCEYYVNPTEESLSAGNITVTGALTPITLEPSTTTPVLYEPAESLPDDLFAPGASLTISAAGATVPAFSGSVTTPAAIANPVLPTALSRATPPTITWTAGSGDAMWVWVMAFDGINPEETNLIWCRTQDTGSFAIPAAAMALLPSASTEGLVMLWRANVTPVIAGSWDVALTATDSFVSDFIAIGP